MHILEQLLTIIAPHECVGCASEGSILCSICQQHLSTVVRSCYRCGSVTKGVVTCASCRHSSPLYALYAVTAYDGIAKEVVQGLKYARQMAGARDIAQALAVRLNTEHLPAHLVLTHVPTAYRRMRVRGYDQAELIAKEVARLCGLPYRSLLLRKGDQRQVGNTRATRQQQMADAFVARELLAQNAHILLIDDVITTGSTLEAAARALKQAGARQVRAAVFAKA